MGDFYIFNIKTGKFMFTHLGRIKKEKEKKKGAVLDAFSDNLRKLTVYVQIVAVLG